MMDLETRTRAASDGEMNDVSFVVLLRSGAAEKRVALDDLRLCLNWFAARGVSVKATRAGLHCETPREMFEFLFGVTLNRRAPANGRPAFEIDGTLKLPAELASRIDRICLQPA